MCALNIEVCGDFIEGFLLHIFEDEPEEIMKSIAESIKSKFGITRLSEIKDKETLQEICCIHTNKYFTQSRVGRIYFAIADYLKF